MQLNDLNRWQAAAIHLGFSFIIFLILLSIILLAWYPGVLFQFGGWQGIKIVAGVDLVLGPALTCIVFNTKKKSLKFDLAIIALIQFAALAYGVQTVHNERPYAIILSHSGLHVLTLGDFKQYNIEPLKTPGMEDQGIPLRAYLNEPPDDKQIHQLEFTSGFVDGRPLEFQTNLYRPFNGKRSEEFDFLTERFPLDRESHCCVVLAVSIHYSKNVCLNTTDGTFKLK